MVWSPGVVKGLGMYSVCPPSIKKEHEAFVEGTFGESGWGLWVCGLPGSGVQGFRVQSWRVGPDVCSLMIRRRGPRLLQQVLTCSRIRAVPGSSVSVFRVEAMVLACRAKTRLPALGCWLRRTAQDVGCWMHHDCGCRFKPLCNLNSSQGICLLYNLFRIFRSRH